VELESGITISLSLHQRTSRGIANSTRSTISQHTLVRATS